MSDDIIKQRFGRYLILDHLVDGGMAKICRARFLGEQADKVVAIKMVQSQYSENPAFKQMFMDEIKLTFGLLHPNIVQTYDYGFHKRQLYVAMEYCDGRNLKEYLDRLRENKYVFPVEISIYIISQVCQGLHYAHTYTNKLTGKAASIIHRDISPHNIMLTYDGAIKIIDFGIAKSNTNSESTQAGTIKGKLSYLAPEYLEGYELDHRYDQFAVGNTLWEMLCSRRLFRAPNDLAVLKKIQECHVPAPSSINPNVPKELDEIVLKAMSKDRSKRFENMDQFNRALIKFLYANYPDFNASDLSYFAKELFKDEIKKDREKLFEFGKINITPYIAEWKKEQDGGSLTSSDIISPAQSDVPAPPKETEKAKPKKDHESHRKENLFDFDSENTIINIDHDNTSTKNSATPATPVGDSDSRRQEFEGISDGKKLKLDFSNNKNVSTAKKDLKNKNDDEKDAKAQKAAKAVRKRNSSRKGTNTNITSVKRDRSGRDAKIYKAYGVAVGMLLMFFTGYKNLPFLKETLLGVDRQPSSEIRDNDIVQAEPKIEQKREEDIKRKEFITLHFPNYDKYKQRLYVNGKASSLDILNQLEMEKMERVTVRVQTPGKKHFVKKFRNPRAHTTINIPQMPQVDYGYLYQSPGCRISGNIYFKLFGENRAERIPLSNKQLGIAFPVNGDDESKKDDNGNTVFELYFQNNKNGQNVRTKVILKFNPDEDLEKRVDLCDII